MTHKELFNISFVMISSFFFFQRLVEAKFHKRVKGTISTPWLTKGMIVMHFIFFLGCILQVFLINKTVDWIISILGLILFWMAFFLRRWAIKTLGVFWSIEIEMRDNHEMVTNGPYKFCRHPNYLAIILEIIGFCLIANAYRLLIFTLIVYIPLLLLRIKAEEVELVKKFSENYIRYIKNTPALLPFNKP